MTITEYAIARMKAKLEATAKRRKLTERELELLQTVTSLVQYYASRDIKKTRSAGQ